jgi:hypothetical protein
MIFQGLGLALLTILMLLTTAVIGGTCSVRAWMRFQNSSMFSVNIEKPRGLPALTTAACIAVGGILLALLAYPHGKEYQAASEVLFALATAGSIICVAAGLLLGWRDQSEGSGSVRIGCVLVCVIDVLCIAGIIASVIGRLK